ncbi:hypothetical protein BZG36_04369 [Bifiguratus adelaidae]|uniref:ATP-dependent DNA helicase n=1 Tax=Bifiguratus adelaidae TaxID=1938954 RepID=A0A261XVW4_9FUNG|nr:hypothetical protein BZG36_04369 [Bifiguratus adelaidae]
MEDDIDDIIDLELDLEECLESDFVDDALLQALDEAEKNKAHTESRGNAQESVGGAFNQGKTLTRQSSLADHFGRSSSHAPQPSSPTATVSAVPWQPATTRASWRDAPAAFVQQPVPEAPSEIQCAHEVSRDSITSWIYPSNMPVREYQFNIVQSALLHNVLVALPTGLGKTFIAAVVMYNYHRWFPKSKVVFMAPTKPLVAQQIEACYKICGIPQNHTVELTGVQPPLTRKALWTTKTVFFLTPQVMQNDLESGICPAGDVVCVVVDEAHRASGNYAYCEVIKNLYAQNQEFRILALTATPGKEIKAVQSVLKNLHITKTEIRTEDSLDIRPYTFGRKVETIIVPIGDALEEIRREFCKPFQYFLNRLNHYKAYWVKDPMQVSRYSLVQARDNFRGSAKNVASGLRNMIEGDFALCISLTHSLQLLLQHGARPFFASVQALIQDIQLSITGGNRTSKARQELIRNPDLTRLVYRLDKELLEMNFVGHPKLDRLIGIVVQHFVDHAEKLKQNPADPGDKTRIIVFSSFRESVDEITRVLSAHAPIVRVMSFVGQASAKNGAKGLTQREQQEVLGKFINGGYNTLVATCIGEEGLDIGDVDLIVCYDSQSSPIRMLQRMGRTGRKREGKISLLLTQGLEERKHRQAQESYKRVQRAMTTATELSYWTSVPRVLPKNVTPVCVRKFFEIPKYDRTWGATTAKRKVAAQANADDDNDGVEADGGLTAMARHMFEKQFFEPCPARFRRGWEPDLSKSSIWQRFACSTHLIGHSRKTIDFVETMALLQDFDIEDRLEHLHDYEARMLQALEKDDIMIDGDDITANRCLHENGDIAFQRFKSHSEDANVASQEGPKRYKRLRAHFDISDLPMPQSTSMDLSDDDLPNLPLESHQGSSTLPPWKSIQDEPLGDSYNTEQERFSLDDASKTESAVIEAPDSQLPISGPLTVNVDQGLQLQGEDETEPEIGQVDEMSTNPEREAHQDRSSDGAELDLLSDLEMDLEVELFSTEAQHNATAFPHHPHLFLAYTQRRGIFEEDVLSPDDATLCSVPEAAATTSLLPIPARSQAAERLYQERLRRKVTRTEERSVSPTAQKKTADTPSLSTASGFSQLTSTAFKTPSLPSNSPTRTQEHMATICEDPHVQTMSPGDKPPTSPIRNHLCIDSNVEPATRQLSAADDVHDDLDEVFEFDLDDISLPTQLQTADNSKPLTTSISTTDAIQDLRKNEAIAAITTISPKQGDVQVPLNPINCKSQHNSNRTPLRNLTNIQTTPSSEDASPVVKMRPMKKTRPMAVRQDSFSSDQDENAHSNYITVYRDTPTPDAHRSPTAHRASLRRLRQKIDDDEMASKAWDVLSLNHRKRIPKVQHNTTKKHRDHKTVNPFVDMEAEVSQESHVNDDESHSDLESMGSLRSFIDDRSNIDARSHLATSSFAEDDDDGNASVDMQAVYMQSLWSPDTKAQRGLHHLRFHSIIPQRNPLRYVPLDRTHSDMHTASDDIEEPDLLADLSEPEYLSNDFM